MNFKVRKIIYKTLFLRYNFNLFLCERWNLFRQWSPGEDKDIRFRTRPSSLTRDHSPLDTTKPTIISLSSKIVVNRILAMILHPPGKTISPSGYINYSRGGGLTLVFSEFLSSLLLVPQNFFCFLNFTHTQYTR